MNADLTPQNDFRNKLRDGYQEVAANDPRMYPGEENEVGWPGDGSGTDDLADMNQNEGESVNENYEGYTENENDQDYRE